MNKNLFLLSLIIIGAFLIRAINITFPAFTSDEARVAFRGYTLETTGKDELGRTFPILFNSLEDYQLPVVSYLTAGGELIFGKTELGARIPFIVLGTMLVFLTFQIAKFFSPNSLFWLTSALLVAFSPPLIFLSKIPNEAIVLTFSLTLLFYLLINRENLLLITPVMIIAALTSKPAWFILFPFVLFTSLFYLKSSAKKDKLVLIGITSVVVFLAFTIFLTVPQAKRSLLENNFLLFSDITISNGINKLRGQDALAGWPSFVDRLLFNKAHFATTGLIQWLTNLNPAFYFGQFDNTGKINYFYLGTWAKILLIPFLLGLLSLIKRDLKKGALIFYLLILTFPAAFVYPNYSLELIVLTLPFMALIISVGFEKLNRKIAVLIFLLMILEIAVNIFFPSPEYKNTTTLRPSWAKQLTYDLFERSKVSNVAVSDDLVSDLVSYIEWYIPVDPSQGFQEIPSPYKYRQYHLGNIKLIGSDENFTTCSKDEGLLSFVSKRDLEKLNEFNIKVGNAYQDINKTARAYLVDRVCLK